jgi:CDP-diacylglycerol pyrophosphatase
VIASRAIAGGVLALLAAAAPSIAASPDILWRIVSQCLEPDAADYCARCQWPVDDRCAGRRACTDTTDVWGETPEYVAIRDIKMCGCPPGFVHGLALPRARVSGVEDPRRPAGLWAFAWEVARSHIADESEIALVVNPLAARTQDQLHVHLVRLAAGGRQRLTAGTTSRTPTLDRVWAVAAERALGAGLADYGVLVAKEKDAPGFLVLVTGTSPEFAFTAAVCR